MTEFTLSLEDPNDFTTLRSKAFLWRNVAAALMDQARLIHSGAVLSFCSSQTSRSCNTLQKKNPINIFRLGATVPTVSFLVTCYWEHLESPWWSTSLRQQYMYGGDLTNNEERDYCCYCNTRNICMKLIWRRYYALVKWFSHVPWWRWKCFGVVAETGHDPNMNVVE